MQRVGTNSRTELGEKAGFASADNVTCVYPNSQDPEESAPTRNGKVLYFMQQKNKVLPDIRDTVSFGLKSTAKNRIPVSSNSQIVAGVITGSCNKSEVLHASTDNVTHVDLNSQDPEESAPTRNGKVLCFMQQKNKVLPDIRDTTSFSLKSTAKSAIQVSSKSQIVADGQSSNACSSFKKHPLEAASSSATKTLMEVTVSCDVRECSKQSKAR